MIRPVSPRLSELPEGTLLEYKGEMLSAQLCDNCAEYISTCRLNRATVNTFDAVFLKIQSLCIYACTYCVRVVVGGILK